MGERRHFIITKDIFEEKERRSANDYCPACGASRRPGGRFCHQCGYDLINDPMVNLGGRGAYTSGQYGVYYQAPPCYQYPYYQYQYNPYQKAFDPREKDPGLALIFSLLFPGLGQLYYGDRNMGIGLIAGFILAAILLVGFFLFSGDPNLDFLILVAVGLILFVLYIWQMFNAFHSAIRYNAKLSPRWGN